MAADTSLTDPRAAHAQARPRPRPLLAAAGIKPRKARTADECEQLEQLPNIGPSLAADLRRLGVQHPRELALADAFQLYRSLCTLSGQRQDPCVLDTFMAATEFMRGAPARPWWDYTAQRKALYGAV
jgi:Pathogenicity locus